MFNRKRATNGKGRGERPGDLPLALRFRPWKIQRIDFKFS